jgi:hypothetical protein
VNCLNCGAELGGRYCAACGQKHDPHRPTFGHFAAETAQSLSHADGRLWKTLRLLLTKPGFLSREFFAGRRASYLPPIRLYIVLSVAFFLALALLPTSSVNPLKDTNLNIDTKCSELQYNGPFKSTMEPRLRAACVRAKADSGAGLGKAFLQNAPKAMWLLLPVFAAIMLLFYWRPRRLYAEHLLYLVHNHSAVFAVLTIEDLVDLAIPDGYDSWLGPITIGYLLWYCYRGMRVFYGDSRRRTLAKFLALGFLYVTITLILLVFTGIASVLSL